MLGVSPGVSVSSGEIPAPREQKHVHLPTSAERRLIRPYVHQDLINLAPMKRHFGVLHHLVLEGEKLLVCLMYWSIKTFLS